jgi:hypothetical protein
LSAIDVIYEASDEPYTSPYAAFSITIIIAWFMVAVEVKIALDCTGAEATVSRSNINMPTVIIKSESLASFQMQAASCLLSATVLNNYFHN